MPRPIVTHNDSQALDGSRTIVLVGAVQFMQRVEEIGGSQPPMGNGYNYSIECWGGGNSPQKQMDVKKFISVKSIGLVSLIETKVQVAIMGCFYQKLCVGWCFSSN